MAKSKLESHITLKEYRQMKADTYEPTIIKPAKTATRKGKKQK